MLRQCWQIYSKGSLQICQQCQAKRTLKIRKFYRMSWSAPDKLLNVIDTHTIQPYNQFALGQIYNIPIFIPLYFGHIPCTYAKNKKIKIKTATTVGGGGEIYIIIRRNSLFDYHSCIEDVKRSKALKLRQRFVKGKEEVHVYLEKIFSKFD